MFWFFKWVVVSIVMIGLAIGLAFGLKQVQNHYCPAYQINEFTGNTGTLPDAVKDGIALLKTKNYRSFLKAYMTEEGHTKFKHQGILDDGFVKQFTNNKAPELLAVLMECDRKGDYTMSENGLRATCTFSKPIGGKNKIKFIKEKGSWRIEN